jgi:hypothetical protein
VRDCSAYSLLVQKPIACLSQPAFNFNLCICQSQEQTTTMLLGTHIILTASGVGRAERVRRNFRAFRVDFVCSRLGDVAVERRREHSQIPPLDHAPRPAAASRPQKSPLRASNTPSPPRQRRPTQSRLEISHKILRFFLPPAS